MKIYREVPVNERLPELNKWVTTIDSANEHIVYRKTEYGWQMRDSESDNTPNINLPFVFWLELVEVTLNSEEILPVEDRLIYQNNWQDIFLENNSCEQLDLLEKYHKALEAAELQVTKLKEQNTELMVRNLELENEIGTLKLMNNAVSKVEADLRYKQALDLYYFNKMNEGVNASEASRNRLIKSLKLAAYGKTE